MAEPSREYLLQIISSSGLTVLGTTPWPELPTVEQAWKVMAGMETAPAATISQKSPHAFAEVDHQWLTQASNNSLFTDDGSFLISIAGRGSREIGWTSVKWSDSADLASNPQSDGDPEFVAMSLNGKHICGVTTEEYDYWVVSHQFD